MNIIAAIPSPSFDSIALGPFNLRLYGVAIAVGVLVAIWIAERRYQALGGEAGVVQRMAGWVIPGGIVGARLYHVLTDFDRFDGNLAAIPQVWKGGLGIWGGVIGGTLGALILLKKEGEDIPGMFHATAAAIPVGQAIGRLGNWFNQELFGRPSELPWALEIEASYRPDRYINFATFHPTFLYEAVWNLCLAVFIAFIAPKIFTTLRTGYMWAVYVFGYTLGRLWIELLRSDDATEIFGVRINVWTSLIVISISCVTIIYQVRKDPKGHRNSSDVVPHLD